MFHGNVAINVFMVYVSLLRILKCCYCWFFVQSNNFNHMVQNASPLLIEKEAKMEDLCNSKNVIKRLQI